MTTTQNRRANPRHLLVLAGSAALALAAQHGEASGQNIQTRLPAFQAPASDSLESEMLSRLSQGQLQPGDLARLARLSVLRSISMLVNVRADLPDSIVGNQLDQEITSLWNSSQEFYDVVSSSPLDAASLEQGQYWLDTIDAATRRVQASLGELPGMSAQAAGDLQSLSRLRGNIGSIMGSLELTLAEQAGPAPERAFSFDALRQGAQLVANGLVSLIDTAGDAGRGRAGRDAIVTELTDLLDRVQDFIRLLSTQPSLKATQDSFRAARRQMWRVESRIIHLDWRVGFERPWRDVRKRMNAVSNELGLPRVIEMAPLARPLTGQERAVAAHVDHAVAWLDEFLSEGGPRLRKTQTGAQFLADVTGLRRELLNLRRRAIAGDPAKRLTELLKVIERSNRQLSDRAGAFRAMAPVPALNPATGTRRRPSGRSSIWMRRANGECHSRWIVREDPGYADRRKVLGQAPASDDR